MFVSLRRSVTHDYFLIFFMRFFQLAILFAIGLTAIPRATAHQVDSVELEFHPGESAWKFEGLLDIAYMLPESRGVEDAPPLFRKDVMKSSEKERLRYTTVGERTMRELLKVEFNGKALEWKIRFPSFEQTPLVLPEEAGGWALMSAEITVEPQPGPGELEVIWKDNLRSELILIFFEDNEIKDLVSIPSGMSKKILTVSAPEPSGKIATTTPSKASSMLSWVTSGFYHVIPLGIDHILFILGLFLLAPRWKPLLIQSLLFTVAHSITLALAVMGLINLPSVWVEVFIAVSIAWVGIENLIVKELKPSRLYLVGCFGLLHGLGFASVLKEKLGDLTGKDVALPLVSFNVGVELAQISLLICAFLILLPLRRWTKTVQFVGSLLIAAAGLFWAYDRLPF